MRYGFIGLENLGSRLAMNLARGGLPLDVCDLDRRNAEPLLAAGAEWAETPPALGARCDAVFTCLPAPAASRSVLAALLPALRPGATWIEMSTLGRDDILALAA